MKYTNADICELVANLEGYDGQVLPPLFNVNEWYGFTNTTTKNNAYFKVCQGADKNGTGNYNFYKNSLNCNEDKIFIIIKDGENFCYREVQCNCFSNSANSKISIPKNSLCCSSIQWKSLIWDENIIEQIANSSQIYNRIMTRKDTVDKTAIANLVNNYPKECHYCGIDIITSPINNLNYNIIWDGKNRCKKIITKRVV